MRPGRDRQLGGSLFAPVLMLVIMLAGAMPLAAQTSVPGATPQGTPVAQGFVLVATIGADEWREPLPAVAPGVDLGDRSLLEALREGGFVIYFRHAATDTGYDQNVDLAYCATQRNLSQRGKDQSVKIGDGFETLGIPVGEVRSSEYCRAKETAALAFGEVELDPNLTPVVDVVDEDEEARKAAALVELLSTSPEPGTNRVIVAHQANIAAVLPDLELDEGEAAVFLPLE